MDLTRIQTEILAALRDGLKEAKKIAARLSQRNTTITENMRKMEKYQLIRWEIRPNNDRWKYYYITDKGLGVVDNWMIFYGVKKC